MQVAALHGDFVTPTVMGAGESDAAREQRGARALFRMLADDETHGAREPADDAGLAGRVDGAGDRTAARQLQPIWSQISEKVVRFEDSLERSRGRLESHGSRHRTRDPEGGQGMTRLRCRGSQLVQQGGRHADEQPGRLRRRRRHARQGGVDVTDLPSMIRVDGVNKVDFDYEEIAEALGWDDFGNDDFEEIMSTHYGRMVVLDDRVLLFANPEDAAEYIGFDLQPVQ